MKSLAKTISWLIVSGILIAGCSWFESGNFTVGLMAAFWACMLKTPVYWIHEIMWDKTGHKTPKANPQVVCVACNEAAQAY